jgi:hypothetical protein
LPTCFSTHFSDSPTCTHTWAPGKDSLITACPDTPDILSDDQYIINERTIALFHLYVTSSLDSGIALKRQKSAVYAAHVQTLMKMNGADGARNWRHELAELLSKWHPIFQGVVKRKGQRLPEHDVQDMDSQVVDASFL